MPCIGTSPSNNSSRQWPTYSMALTNNPTTEVSHQGCAYSVHDAHTWCASTQHSQLLVKGLVCAVGTTHSHMLWEVVVLAVYPRGAYPGGQRPSHSQGQGTIEVMPLKSAMHICHNMTCCNHRSCALAVHWLVLVLVQQRLLCCLDVLLHRCCPGMSPVPAGPYKG